MNNSIDHYHHLQEIHHALGCYYWSRQQTRKDAIFIEWLDKELLKVSNEAYQITQANTP